MKMFSNYKRHFPRSYIMGTLIRRREDPEYATEMLNEFGTTDMAIGDVTAEVMLTTIGKIPNEMYELEETSVGGRAMAEGHHETETIGHEKSSENVSGFAAHTTFFIVLSIALLLLLTICCVVACIIARARSKFSDSGDVECDKECNGARQPLINSDKMSETTSKSSGTSTRN